MKKLLILLLFFALSASAARAQQVNIQQVSANVKTNTNATPNTITEEDLISRFSTITPISNLMQTAAAANNVANINVAGNSNTTTITQAGSNNIGAINISGFNDNIIRLNQTGTNLLSLITIEGPGNTLDMDQSGSDLGNLVQVEGSGINVDLTQDASGFRYIQQGAVNPIAITSTSRYVPIIIRNN